MWWQWGGLLATLVAATGAVPTDTAAASSIDVSSPAAWTFAQQGGSGATVEQRLLALEAAVRLGVGTEGEAGAEEEQRWRRLDALDARLQRLDAVLELRLDKLHESLSARHLRLELGNEQAVRGMEGAAERLADRLHRRLGYTETRIELALAKTHAAVEALAARVAHLDALLQTGQQQTGQQQTEQQPPPTTDPTELQQLLHAVNASAVSAQQQCGGVATEVQALRGDLNRTLATMQNDGQASSPLRHERHATSDLLAALDRHANGLGAKVTNMYNELWRRSQVLEGLSKDAMALSNATRRELQEGVRSVAMHLARFCSLQTDKAKPGSVESFEGTLNEMSQKMAYYFQTIVSTQHVFLESCHRIQDGEDVLEKYLTQLLERMVDIIASNKCQSEVEEVHELLKSHHSTVVRNVGHNTNTVMRAADNSSKEAKNLAGVINEVQEGLLATTNDIHQSLSKMHNGQVDVQETLEKIAAAMAEFQTQLVGLTRTTASEENPEKHCFCSDNRALGANLTAEVKKLLQENIILNRAELQNLTQKLILELQNEVNNLLSNRLARHKDYNEKQTPALSNLKNFSEENQIISEMYPTVIVKDPLLEQNTRQRKDDLKSQTHPTSAELTIKIIPTSHELESRNIFPEKLESPPSTLEVSKESVTNGEEGINAAEERQTLVTIVHNDKPLTAEGQVTYSSDFEGTSNLTVRNGLANHQFLGSPISNQNSSTPPLVKMKNNTQEFVSEGGSQNTSSHATQEPPVFEGHSNTLPLKSVSTDTDDFSPQAQVQLLLTKLREVHGNSHEIDLSNNTYFHVWKSLNVSKYEKSRNPNRSDIPPESEEHIRNQSISSSEGTESDLSMQQLLSKLEALTKRLVTSASGEHSLPDQSEEDSEEEEDYTQTDNNATTN